MLALARVDAHEIDARVAEAYQQFAGLRYRHGDIAVIQHRGPAVAVHLNAFHSIGLTYGTSTGTVSIAAGCQADYQADRALRIIGSWRGSCCGNGERQSNYAA